MSSRPTRIPLPTHAPIAAAARPARVAWPERSFYSGAALLLLVLVVLGFHRFYTEGRAYPGRELAAPIRTLLIAHGVSMTAWMVLFAVQPLLAALRRIRVHRWVGTFGSILALAVTVLGWQVGIEAMRVVPEGVRPWGMTPEQFLIVPLGSIALFAGFVGLGVWARKRPALHRPMMLLGTMAAMSAAIGRIDALNTPFAGTVWEHVFGPFTTTLLCGALLLVVRCLVTRSFERWFAAGLAVQVLASAAFVQIAPTELWHRIARALLA